MTLDSFGARGTLGVGDDRYRIWRLAALEGLGDVARLPYSIKILLENLLRHEDGTDVSSDHIAALSRWPTDSGSVGEVAFSPERVLLQDFTGVPAVVDLAALRDALVALGGDPALVNPKVPVELVIDHSVIAEVSGTPDAFTANAAIELERNVERYQLLRWAAQAFEQFTVVPPDTGICHQVNLEYLARVIFATEDGEAFPDTLVGTDSHTPMVNGLGVLGWGVGGIEAEAAMLGQPLPMPIPAVVGVELRGELPPTATATDLVLTMAELLRRRGVVGKFVELTGPGLGGLRAEHRATLGNMSPEYGATCTISPIDNQTLDYLRLTGRSPAHVALVERYAKEQGLFHEPGGDLPTFSETVVLDLSGVEPSIAGPARPQDRVGLSRAQAAFRVSLARLEPDAVPELGLAGLAEMTGDSPEEASAESFPASDPPSAMAGLGAPGAPDLFLQTAPVPNGAALMGELARRQRPVPAKVDGHDVAIDDGHVVIAAITSCTNTSNPQVMVAAGLLARRAVERGLRPKPWVKTSLAPGSRVVTDYLSAAGLIEPLAEIGFYLVGYGCTTCIGNSGPLLPGVSDAVIEGQLAVCAVLSGNRNFEGRIHPEVRMNYLASPPLVVAYALAGTMDIDLTTEALGVTPQGEAVLLADLWPSPVEIDDVVRKVLGREQFIASYSSLYDGGEAWAALDVGGGTRFSWQRGSTYVKDPPFLDGVGPRVPDVVDILGARALAVLADSVTTDHISPAGSIPPSGPAGRWLLKHDVARHDFNSFGARRGNHEVMLRGTFANVRLRNALVPGTEGGVTRHLPSGDQLPIFDAAQRYRDEAIPLVVLAGKDYGSGSSRDWAAKGTMLLGVRAVLAGSFERIHRSNLIGMGVLPLQFAHGASVESLGLSGEESFDMLGLDAVVAGTGAALRVLADDRELPVIARLDTPSEREHYRHGGILPFVLRNLALK
ncbi:MAG TPA: aconitate hydratase [Acidimicrobiales bacterium]|nr:aconitate hydratase [Acidimicrobiales bacterium]